MLYLVDVHVAVHHGIDGEGGDTLHTQFVHDVLAVGDDRGKSDIQFVGDLFVDVALHNQ